MEPGITETATKDGYVLDNAVKDFTVSDGKVNGQSNLTITVENDYTKLDLAKVDSGTGENISERNFLFWIAMAVW